MSRGHVRVRPAENADLSHLVALAEESDLPMGDLGARIFHATAFAQLRERFATVLDDPRKFVFVAVDDASERVVGMIIVSEDEAGALLQVPVLTATNLVVAPGFRRRGVGRALLAAVVHLADEKEIEHVVATAVTGSRDANRYLARLGFAPLVVRRIAPIPVLRRSLGIVEAPQKLAMLRRARLNRAAGDTTIAG